jgi:predicted nucleotidyltransferase
VLVGGVGDELVESVFRILVRLTGDQHRLGDASNPQTHFSAAIGRRRVPINQRDTRTMPPGCPGGQSTLTSILMGMSQPRQALDILLVAAEDGRLEELCGNFGVDLVSVFGSVLDHSKADPSDLDVAIRFDPSTTATDLLGLVSALVELVGTETLDVLVLNGASVVARSRALGPGARGLFEKRPGLYALAQMAAMAEEMETAPMRRRDLELLAER